MPTEPEIETNSSPARFAFTRRNGPASFLANKPNAVTSIGVNLNPAQPPGFLMPTLKRIAVAITCFALAVIQTLLV